MPVDARGIERIGYTDATGFVAYDNTNHLIVLSFRGSHDLNNFITDAVYALTPTPFCVTCMVHAGFYTSWQEVRDGVIDAVQKAVKTYPNARLFSVGRELILAQTCVNCCAQCRGLAVPRVSPDSSLTSVGKKQIALEVHWPQLPLWSYGTSVPLWISLHSGRSRIRVPEYTRQHR